MGKRGEARINHLRAASDRKKSEIWVVPMNAMVPGEEIDSKTQKPIMVPDPRRGTKIAKMAARPKLKARAEQERKIAVKREGRRKFAKLSPGEKIAAREKGAPSRGGQ